MATQQLHLKDAVKLSNTELQTQILAAKGDTEAIKALNDALTNAASQGFNDFLESKILSNYTGQ